MRTLAGVLLLGLLGGCSGDTRGRSSPETITAFPLKMGTMWILSSAEYSLTLQVDTILTIGNSECARLTELSCRGTEAPIQRTLFLAEDAKGNITKWCLKNSSRIPDASDSSTIWYRFDAQTGVSWSANGNSHFNQREIHAFRITLLSRSDTVRTTLATYVTCYKFYVDDLAESDTEYYDWVAPGIGLVKRQFGENDNMAFVLKSFEAPQ